MHGGLEAVFIPCTFKKPFGKARFECLYSRATHGDTHCFPKVNNTSPSPSWRIVWHQGQAGVRLDCFAALAKTARMTTAHNMVTVLAGPNGPQPSRCFSAITSRHNGHYVDGADRYKNFQTASKILVRTTRTLQVTSLMQAASQSAITSKLPILLFPASAAHMEDSGIILRNS